MSSDQPSGTASSHDVPDRPAGVAARDPKELAFDDIVYDVADGVARVTLNRPERYNAYTAEELVEIRQAVLNAGFDDRIGVVVLTGAGTDAFCTGGDLKRYAKAYTRRPRDYWKYMQRFRQAVESILRCGKPVIARLNGITVEGGNELHLACDLSVAAEHAYLGVTGVGVGSVACGGATQWLPLAVGDRRAREMLMTNEQVPARKAKEWGLVTEVAPSVTRDGDLVEDPSEEAIEKARDGEDGHGIDLAPLDEEVDALCDRILEMFPECLRYTKEQVNVLKEQTWNQTIGHAADWLSLHFASREPYEGMTAFAEKRDPPIEEIRREMAAGGASEFLHGPPDRECPSCGTRGLPADFAFCGNCGEKL